MAFRLLGMFMILPVFSAYLTRIPHATPMLLGIAIGIYGLTQACLQIPFGLASDLIGRKIMITIGLGLFIVGSLVAGYSHGIYGIIIGRAIQGSGAIGSSLLALLADNTRDENRSKAMAMMGMMIGTAFSLAMIIGPWVSSHFGLQGIFILSALLGAFGLVIIWFGVPQTPHYQIDRSVSPTLEGFKAVFKSKQLLRLDASIFFQHAIFTAFFVAIPILLTEHMHFSAHHQSLLYLIIMTIAFIIMMPLVMFAEVKRVLRPVFIACILALLATQLLFLNHHSDHTWSIIALLIVFFIAFNLLEATLPSWVSKVAPLNVKGCALGVYSTCQFLGIFVGGTLGGIALHHDHISGIFLLTSGLAILWLISVSRLKNPPYLSTLILPMDEQIITKEMIDTLRQEPGVADTTDFAHLSKGKLLYIKYDKRKIDEKALRNVLQTGSLRVNK
jgi:MFS family permease